MLQYSTIEPRTLDLLKKLMQLPELENFYLVGGTALSLYYGHPNQQLLISIPQALTYFADAEESEDPVSLKGQKWNDVKKKIQHAVNIYLQ